MITVAPCRRGHAAISTAASRPSVRQIAAPLSWATAKSAGSPASVRVQRTWSNRVKFAHQEPVHAPRPDARHRFGVHAGDRVERFLAVAQPGFKLHDARKQRCLLLFQQRVGHELVLSGVEITPKPRRPLSD